MSAAVGYSLASRGYEFRLQLRNIEAPREISTRLEGLAFLVLISLSPIPPS